MNDCFKDFITGASNLEAYKMVEQIAFNQFSNHNKPIVLFATTGNGKNHLVKNLIKFSKAEVCYDAVHLIQFCNKKKHTQFIKFKTGLIIFQHCQLLKGDPEVQKKINEFCKSYNYELGNILLTTDTPINELFDFSMNFTDVKMYKPSYDLKEKILINRWQSQYLKSITESEVFEICSIGFDGIRFFEGMLFMIFSNFKLHNTLYSETISKIKNSYFPGSE